MVYVDVYRVGITGEKNVDTKTIQLELERVETACERNTDERLVYGLIAKGIWQVALQLAKLNESLFRSER